MKTLLLSFLLTFQPYLGHAYEIVAHRGVHQTYSRDEQTMESCTAEISDAPIHSYLENTLPSIRKAFEYGATMVELDVHPTSEEDPLRNQLVVFHDWTLNCRTDASCEGGCKCHDKVCVTDQQTLRYLKTLDLGYGYTPDGGKTHPFRGTAIGAIPTFLEAVMLLNDFPEKRLLVNVKDKYEKTQKLLLQELSRVPPDIRSRVYVEYWKEFASKFAEIGVPEAIWQKRNIQDCLKRYIPLAWTGYFPAVCRNLKFFMPLHQDLVLISRFLKGYQVTTFIYGWPDRFIKKMKEHGSEVYLSAVETEEDLRFAKVHAFSGIMTNKIEVIGPLLSQHPR